MKRRRPLVRAHHVVIRNRARRRARIAARFQLEAPRPDASLLRGHVDEPVRDDQVDKFGFRVRGWCAWGDRPALAVAICLDGVVVGRAVVGTIPRRDVAEASHNKNLCDTGWQVHVGPGRWRRGESVDLSVLVWGEATVPPVVLDKFPIIIGADESETARHGDDLPGEYVGHLDEPRSGQWVGEVFPVRGWAMRRRDPVGRLDVLVNGERIGSARLGLPNPGLEVNEAGSDAIISGFEHWVDLSSVSSDTSSAKLQLVAGSSDGPPVALFERVVRVRPTAPRAEPSDRAILYARRRQELVAAIAAPRTPELNLVVFTHQLDYGGGQLWLDEFLKKSGAGTRFACTVISFKDGPLLDEAEQRGIAVHVTDEPPVDDPERYEGRITELAALVAGGGHNVALVNTGSVFSGADVAARLSLPTIWAIHESFTPQVLMAVAFGHRIDPRLLDAARRAMESADALVFEAQATRDLYATWAGPNRSVVIPYGVDTGEILSHAQEVSRDDARADVGVEPESKMILVMGTVEQRKAQTRIAQAFARIADDHPKWNLVFVGDNRSAYSQALKEYVRALGLDHRCSVFPVDRDPYRWYRAADVLLSASDVESLPRSMLEAMCFGVPVVSASVFGVPELLRDGETGFLFEPNDLDALMAVLYRVLALDPPELERVGDAGRRHVLEHYDSSGYAGDLLRLCQGLLQSPGAIPGELLSKGSPLGDLHLDAAR